MDTLNQPSPPPGTLPPTDLLDDGVVWTPEIDRLMQATAEQIRLDQPGMIAWGLQRNGKSKAMDYLAAMISLVMGYPIAVVQWLIPDDVSKTTRQFFQSRLLQSGCEAIQHRDLAVIRSRLFKHLADIANAVQARRLLVIIDEAQNLNHAEHELLVYLFNELERIRLRPFFLLVGQPELGKVSAQWLSAGAQQMVGRFATRAHEYLGVRSEDFETLLDSFDDASDEQGACPSSRTSPDAYAHGWRLRHLAPVMQEALRQVAAAQNVREELHLPMQYFRSFLLAVLYRLYQTQLPPESFSVAEATNCLKASNFAAVLQYYVKSEGGRDQRGMSH